MNTVRYRALAKDGNWRYGEYPHSAPEMSNTHYPMDIFWKHFLSTFRRETLGQWTGLLDKHGKEIYEGDVVAFEDFKGNNRWEVTRKLPVVFGGGAFTGKGERGSLTFLPKHIEIIGNIYENPELLSKNP